MNPPLLLQRLRSVHESLHAGGFDHAVGGAIALAVHVREPRFTADIDLNVLADAQSPDPLLASLPSDLDEFPDAAQILRRDGQIRLFWRSPDTPLDLFLPQHPTFHALVISRAEPTGFLGAGIKVMQATDLIVFKALFNRSKDWVDIESLAENQAGDIDEATWWINTILADDGQRADRLRRTWHDASPTQKGLT